MFHATQFYTGDGTTAVFSVPFPYLERPHVKVEVELKEISFEFMSDNTIRITPAPPSSTQIKIYRDTPIDRRRVDFSNVAYLSEKELDDSALQLFYATQESADRSLQVMLWNSALQFDADDRPIVNIKESTEPSAAVTYGQMKPYLDVINDVVQNGEQTLSEYQKLTNMNAVALQSPAGTPPKAEYDRANGTMTFTIPKGDRGERGEQGPQGVQGVPGGVGDQGPRGLQGIQGPQGDDGPKGDTGDQGPRGAQGVRGEQGEVGPRGQEGAKGDKGDTGDQGPRGAQGPIGPKGDTGDKGATGDRGPTGLQGEVGPKGERGDKGSIGDTPLGLAFGEFTIDPDGMLNIEFVGHVADDAFFIDDDGYINVNPDANNNPPQIPSN